MALSQKTVYFALGVTAGAICCAGAIYLLQYSSFTNQALPTTTTAAAPAIQLSPTAHRQPVQQQYSVPTVPDDWIKQEINGQTYYLAPLTRPHIVHRPLQRGPLLEKYPLGCTDAWDLMRLDEGIE
jgi:hypothetical protein